MLLPNQKGAVCSHLPSDYRDTKYQAKQSMEQQHNAYFIVVSVYIIKKKKKNYDHFFLANATCESVLLQKDGFQWSWK